MPAHNAKVRNAKAAVDTKPPRSVIPSPDTFRNAKLNHEQDMFFFWPVIGQKRLTQLCTNRDFA